MLSLPVNSPVMKNYKVKSEKTTIKKKIKQKYDKEKNAMKVCKGSNKIIWIYTCLYSTHMAIPPMWTFSDSRP